MRKKKREMSKKMKNRQKTEWNQLQKTRSDEN